MIYYDATGGGSDAGNSGVISGSSHTFNVSTNDEYTVRIVALSAQLPSTVTNITTVTGQLIKVIAILFFHFTVVIIMLFIPASDLDLECVSICCSYNIHVCFFCTSD